MKKLLLLLIFLLVSCQFSPNTVQPAMTQTSERTDAYTKDKGTQTETTAAGSSQRGLLVEAVQTNLSGEAGESKPTSAVPEFKPKVEVPYDLKVEEEAQKSVDEGHSPWRLDPVFVAQVFVSLKISPGGITGDYPVKYEDLKVVFNKDGKAIIAVNNSNSPVRRVYLEQLVRQDPTGIWTVVGYDPA